MEKTFDKDNHKFNLERYEKMDEELHNIPKDSKEYDEHLKKIQNYLKNGLYQIIHDANNEHKLESISEFAKQYYPTYFCQNCMRIVSVEYHVKENKVQHKYWDKHIECKCQICGNIIVPEVFEEINEAYGLENKLIDLSLSRGIIQLYNVRELPLKYNIDEEYLSKMIDFEISNNNYQIISMKQSMFLINLYNNPEEYLKLLYENKDKLPEEVFTRSEAATLYMVINGIKDNLKPKRKIRK